MKSSTHGSASSIQDELYRRMRNCLAAPPSRAGISIKSEPALARMLGLKRPTVRKVIDRLVEEGILVRRNGSGTYVRKVAPVDEPPTLEETSLLNGESLFNIFEERQQRCAPLNEDKKFRIGTLINFSAENLSGVYRRIFDGLNARGKEIGARVEIHPLAKVYPEDRSKDQIRALIETDQFDGMIVTVDDELLVEALSEQKPRPVVYLDFANRDWNLRADLGPYVSFDLRQAMIGGVKQLFASGHRQIAMVGFSAGPRGILDEEEDRLLYQYIMKRLGLRYRNSIFLSHDKKGNRRQLEALMADHSAPTAIYFADDVALRCAYPVLKKLGYHPGRNLAVISHSNKGIPLPEGVDWSRMEFDPLQVATLTLDIIVAEMKSALPDIISLAHKPTWVAGSTHCLP